MDMTFESFTIRNFFFVLNQHYLRESSNISVLITFFIKKGKGTEVSTIG